MNDELTGAMYIGSVVINKSLTKCRTEETEIIIQLAINKLLNRIGRRSKFPFGSRPATTVNAATSIIGHAPMESINDTACDISFADGYLIVKSNETEGKETILKHSLRSISMSVRDSYENTLFVYISNLDISERRKNTGRNRRLFLFEMKDSLDSKKLFNMITTKFTYPTQSNTPTHIKLNDLKI